MPEKHTYQLTIDEDPDYVYLLKSSLTIDQLPEPLEIIRGLEIFDEESIKDFEDSEFRVTEIGNIIHDMDVMLTDTSKAVIPMEKIPEGWSAKQIDEKTVDYTSTEGWSVKVSFDDEYDSFYIHGAGPASFGFDGHITQGGFKSLPESNYAAGITMALFQPIVETKDTPQRYYDQFGDQGVWNEHPDFSKEDWQYEVSQADTILGYWEWAQQQEQHNMEEYGEDWKNHPDNDEAIRP